MPPPDAPATPGGHRAIRGARRIAAGAVLGALVALLAIGVPTGKAALLAIGPSVALHVHPRFAGPPALLGGQSNQGRR